MKLTSVITPDRFDRRLAEAVSYAVAVLVMALAPIALVRLEATPIQFFLGLLGALNLCLLMIVLGILNGPKKQ